MRKTMCILLATALTTSMLSETPFLSRSVHSPMSYPTKAVCFDADIRHTEYDSDSLLVWDFSNILPGEHSNVYSFTQNDSSSLVINKFGSALFSSTQDGYEKAQFFNNSQQISFAKPEKILKFPFVVGDSISSHFYASGTLNNSDFLRIAGVSSVKADGWGLIALPDGDSIKNIVRLHIVRTGGILIDPQCQHNSSQDCILTDAEIAAMAMTDSVTFVDEHWLWLSANHPLPIVEMQATHIYNHLAEVDFRQSATFIPASEQPMRFPSQEEKEEAETLMRALGKRHKSTAIRRIQATNGFSSMELSIKPKITDGKFVIACSEIPGKANVFITNAAGKTIRFYKDADFPLLCDIGGETCGVFIVTVLCENSILFSDSVLKK